MQEFGFYHPDRGYWQTIGRPSKEILKTYPEGFVEVELKPSRFHEFDGSAWKKVPNTEIIRQLAEEIRAARDSHLSGVVDPVMTNSRRWAEMPEWKQKEWEEYRRALLDLTNQKTFPKSVVWPIKPE